MLKISSLMAIVPMAVLLTISFFVLVTIRKIEGKWLKAFGYVVVTFLWLAALVVFSGAVYRMGKGTMLMKRMMQQGRMQGVAMPGNKAMGQNLKSSGMVKCGGNKGVIFKAE